MPIGPEIKEGFAIQLTGLGSDERENTFWRVRRKEWFSYETGQGPTAEFSSTASGSNTGFVEIANIKPAQSPPRLYWVSWGVRDAGRYFVQIKAGSARFGTDLLPNAPWVDYVKSPYFAPDAEYSFWLIHDWTPAFSYTNRGRYSNTPRIWFEGLKFDIDKIPDQTIVNQIRLSGRYSIITVGGVGQAAIQGA